MTIPAKRRLVLRRAAGERQPQRPDKRKGVRLGVQTQKFWSDSPHELGSGAKIRSNDDLGGGKWEIWVHCCVTPTRTGRRGIAGGEVCLAAPVGIGYKTVGWAFSWENS